MKPNFTLCLIVPYFGKFPASFNLFLESCKNNPTIDWLIITDNIININIDNIQVVNKSFDDFKIFVQNKFDFPIALDNAYKLCDFRPAYGYLFEDYISKYDFWGHCDVDLIFGNIRKFINDNVFSKYDKILTCGHLSLYRNTPEINRWFMSLDPIENKYSYNKIFSSPENFAFDEFGGKKSWGGMVKMIKNSGVEIYDEMYFDDIRQTQWSFYSRRLIEGLPYSLNELSKMPSYYSYKNGILLRHILTPVGVDVSESLYVHFQKRKMDVDPRINCNSYLIVPNIFLPADSNLDDVWKRASYRIIYLPYIMRRFKNLVRKVKRVLRICLKY